MINSVYPLLKKEFPGLKITIAGQHANKIHNGHSGINIIEIALNDTESVIKLYKTATLFIAPIFGPGGTRLKILAAMACGLPIISTTTGVEGLAVENKRDVLLANSPEEFTAQIKLILQDKSLYNTLRENAHRLVMKKYNWKTIAKELENTYKKIKP